MIINGLNGTVNDQSGSERDGNRKQDPSGSRQTEWEVPGLISNACCPALALQPSCKRKTERKRTLIDESLPFVHPLFIGELDLA